MVDPSNLRSYRRPSAKGAALQASQRARSVPASSPKRPVLLDITMSRTPGRPHKNASMQRTADRLSQSSRPHATQPTPGPSQTRAVSAPRSPKVKSQTHQTAGISALQSTVRPSRKRARTTSPSPHSARTAREDSATSSRVNVPQLDLGLLTPAPSSQSRTDPKQPRKSRRALPTVRSAAKDSSGGKGKGRARPSEVDNSSVDESASASVSSGDESSRPTKRRRLDPPSAFVETFSGAGETSQSAMDIDMSGVDEEALDDSSFHLLDIPEVVTLPWVPADRALSARDAAKSNSLYIPPGISELIEGMKRALDLESKARRKAEDRYVEEVQRRVEAERTMAALVAQNTVLDAETRVWARAAADTFAMTISSQLSQAEADGRTEQEPLANAASQETLVAETASSPITAAPADPKGKGRMVDHDIQTRAPGTGMSSKVLERAAAFQEFFKQMYPLPPRDSEG